VTRRPDELFADYQARRKESNQAVPPRLVYASFKAPPFTADANRQKRRALIKTVGARQFRKMSRRVEE